MLLVGFHGTSDFVARQILREGFKNVNARMRAGPGAYFWAGEGELEVRATSLARHWAEQKRSKGDFGSVGSKIAVIRAEFEVDPNQYIDLDQRGHHQGLVAFRAQAIAMGWAFDDEGALYAAYTAAQEMAYEKRGLKLQVAKALMPAPAKFSWDFTPYLTKNVMAYIVRPNALDLIGSSALSLVNQ